ncbi:hypothetical protein HOB83_01735 [Candidatus Woesearchaeota archaeon]|jgi:hypothetical protein|nr:hypothetical protein [Candidatus Woesearchaeota archaeon]MBT4367804.1 hypothetical protein [Candidatus Woesearchaeota archaeon]MBT4712292.1 hypothetical protein [Candidatus Woesearchaeota archaeon]MBT6638840.1 hypothetical protein [Candidatus Woesearchaeota archaeon]MBT7134484.1 hypothetical protein [Candidatus Woesearchaeota archaeon]
MKKRGFLSHVTNLILAAIVILVIIVIVAKFMQGLGGNEFHPGSEMTLERVKEQIDILMDSEEAFAETTLRFSIHEDYLFMAGDKSSIKGMPLIQAMLENIPNQYAAYNHAEPKCKDRSCVCILNQDNKPLCKSFLNEITFVGEEGKNPRSPPYLGSQIRGSPNGNVALAKFNLTTLYVAKIVIDDDRSGKQTFVYITPIMRSGTWGLTIEQIRAKMATFKEKIAAAAYEKNYELVSCSTGANGFYRSTDEECSRLYLSENHQQPFYPSPSSQIISLGKLKDFYEAEDRLSKPYCCQVINADTECTSQALQGYATCSDTLSCSSIKYTNPHNGKEFPSISIGSRGCDFTCCYAYGAKPRILEFNSAVYCEDEIKNYEETDVDCGGTKCEKCELNKRCEENTDCAENLVCEEKRDYELDGRGRRLTIPGGFVFECKGEENQSCTNIADCKFGLKCKDEKCVLKEEGDLCEAPEHCGEGLICEMRKCVDLEKREEEARYKLYEIQIQKDFNTFTAAPIYAPVILPQGEQLPSNYRALGIDYFEPTKPFSSILDGELVYQDGTICEKEGLCLNELTSCGEGCEESEYCCSFFDKCMNSESIIDTSLYYQFEAPFLDPVYVKLENTCLPKGYTPVLISRAPFFSVKEYSEITDAEFLFNEDEIRTKESLELGEGGKLYYFFKKSKDGNEYAPIYVDATKIANLHYTLEQIKYGSQALSIYYKDIKDGEFIFEPNQGACPKGYGCHDIMEYNCKSELTCEGDECCSTDSYCCEFSGECIPKTAFQSTDEFYSYAGPSEGFFSKIGERCIPPLSLKTKSSEPYFIKKDYSQILGSEFVFYQGDDSIQKATIEEQQSE